MKNTSQLSRQCQKKERKSYDSHGCFQWPVVLPEDFTHPSNNIPEASSHQEQTQFSPPLRAGTGGTLLSLLLLLCVVYLVK